MSHKTQSHYERKDATFLDIKLYYKAINQKRVLLEEQQTLKPAEQNLESREKS